MTEIKIREKNPDPWPHQHPGGGVGSTSSSQKKRKKKGGCGLTLPPDWLHPPCPPPHYPPSHTLIHTPSGETACQRKCSRTLGHRLIIHWITQESSVCVFVCLSVCVWVCLCVVDSVCLYVWMCAVCRGLHGAGNGRTSPWRCRLEAAGRDPGQSLMTSERTGYWWHHHHHHYYCDILQDCHDIWPKTGRLWHCAVI